MTGSLTASIASPRPSRLGFWLPTGFFAIWMLFTAYAQLAVPAAQEALVKLGTPNYLRIELSLAKIIGSAVLLLPVSPRLKEWAYAGFAINLVSAFIAHVAAGEGPEKYIWALVAMAILFASYYSFRRQNQ